MLRIRCTALALLSDPSWKYLVRTSVWWSCYSDRHFSLVSLFLSRALSLSFLRFQQSCSWKRAKVSNPTLAARKHRESSVVRHDSSRSPRDCGEGERLRDEKRDD